MAMEILRVGLCLGFGVGSGLRDGVLVDPVRIVVRVSSPTNFGVEGWRPLWPLDAGWNVAGEHACQFVFLLAPPQDTCAPRRPSGRRAVVEGRA